MKNIYNESFISKRIIQRKNIFSLSFANDLLSILIEIVAKLFQFLKQSFLFKSHLLARSRTNFIQKKTRIVRESFHSLKWTIHLLNDSAESFAIDVENVFIELFDGKRALYWMTHLNR